MASDVWYSTTDPQLVEVVRRSAADVVEALNGRRRLLYEEVEHIIEQLADNAVREIRVRLVQEEHQCETQPTSP